MDCIEPRPKIDDNLTDAMLLHCRYFNAVRFHVMKNACASKCRFITFFYSSFSVIKNRKVMLACQQIKKTMEIKHWKAITI